MEKKKVVPVWVSVILVILLVAGIVLNFTMTALFSKNAIFIPISILDGIVCVLSLIYCFKGYSKNAAVFFKIFCIAYCISCVIPIFRVATTYKTGSIVSILTLALHLIVFACLSIMTVAKDLGKKKSLALAWITLASTLINGLVGSTVGSASFVLGMSGKIILSIVFVIMIYAKYMDKASRGAK